MKRKLYRILENVEPSLKEWKLRNLKKLIDIATIRSIVIPIWALFALGNFNWEILKKGYIYLFIPWASILSIFSLLIIIESKLGF